MIELTSPRLLYFLWFDTSCFSILIFNKITRYLTINLFWLYQKLKHCFALLASHLTSIHSKVHHKVNYSIIIIKYMYMRVFIYLSINQVLNLGSKILHFQSFLKIARWLCNWERHPWIWILEIAIRLQFSQGCFATMQHWSNYMGRFGSTVYTYLCFHALGQHSLCLVFDFFPRLSSNF